MPLNQIWELREGRQTAEGSLMKSLPSDDVDDIVRATVKCKMCELRERL
jgi:hypothetical protein